MFDIEIIFFFYISNSDLNTLYLINNEKDNFISNILSIVCIDGMLSGFLY